MRAFQVFTIEQMVPNRAKHHICCSTRKGQYEMKLRVFHDHASHKILLEDHRKPITANKSTRNLRLRLVLPSRY